ncbi:MAG: hypothetical protein KC413_06505 [Anaerolineales bacterium]|nr:hypothetical protein [Anaerolineales bacterium]MCA9975380.1 hypothetical protein [Anaerolineales bacterium]MCB8965983.1 hypothetical protein [Ardenticatenaceae bacterium]
MIGFLVQAMGKAMVAAIMLDLVNDLGNGALEGLAAGAAVGAVIWSINKAPDTMGRVLLFVIVGGLLMALVQLVLILSTLPEVTMASLMAAFQEGNAQTSRMIIQAGRLIGFAALGGALVAVLFSVPGEALKGALVGLGLGALLGAGLNVLLKELSFPLNPLLFQLVIGLFTWGALTAVSGK